MASGAKMFLSICCSIVLNMSDICTSQFNEWSISLLYSHWYFKIYILRILAYNVKLSYCLKPYIYLNMSPKVRKNTRRNGNANARMKRLMSKVRCWAVSSQIYFSGMAWSLWVRCNNGIGHETSTENNIGSVGSMNPSQAGSLGSKLKYSMLD